MANRNYIAGRAFEYTRMKVWRDEYRAEMVMRTAGSHGLFDLIVVTNQGEVIFIQCKVTENKTTADRMLREFSTEPPLGNKSFHKFKQLLEVKVKGSSEVRTATI